jgi:hypothetical protein
MRNDISFAAAWRGNSRSLIVALACLAMLACGCSDAKTDTTKNANNGVFDTSQLPRMPGAKEIFASATSTIFVSPKPIGPTADSIETALAAAGWQKYVAPHTAYRQDSTMRTMNLKKGSHALNVFITVAPAQNNAISVQYSMLPLKIDLPFTKDASKIEYSPERPSLKLITAAPVEQTLDFYRKEMAERGWSLWSEKANGKQAPGGPSGTIRKGGGSARYISEKFPSVTLALTLQKADAGKFEVEIKAWSARVLEAAHRAYLNRDNSAPLVEVARLPRLPGAREASDSTTTKTVYSVPGNLPATFAAIKTLLTADGWKPYVVPLDRPHTTWLTFKKGQQGLSVHFTISVGTNAETTKQTTVSYSAQRLQFAPPVPDDAAEIVFDERRPYLSLNTAGTVDSTRDFYNERLLAADWSPLSEADAMVRWPNAETDFKFAAGNRTFFRRGRERVIMLSLQKRDDGRTTVEIRVPPFAGPQSLEAGSGYYGLPSPKLIKRAGGTGGKREHSMYAHVPAEVSTVLAFYRRELAAIKWREEKQDAGKSPDEIVIRYSSPEGPAVLTVGHRYDLTTVSLVQKITNPPVEATARGGDSVDKMLNGSIDDILKQKQRMMREATKDIDAQIMSMPGMPKPPAAEDRQGAPGRKTVNGLPVPIPDSAANVKYDGGKGSLDYTASSSVRATADFYRSEMKRLGWREGRSVINRSNMVVLNLSKADKAISFTMMRMGNKTKVSANGSGLKGSAAAAAKPAHAPIVATADDLVVETKYDFPVPKRHSSVGLGKTQFRREFNAEVQIGLEDVLEFYRRELGKMDWKEDAKAASVTADKAVVGFTTAKGPAVLTLGRKESATAVEIVVKDTNAAKKAGVLPKPGRSKILLGNVLDFPATITIGNQTKKLGAGSGAKKPDGPSLELRPGKYRYSIKSRGKPAQRDEIEVGADQIWGLLIAPGGGLALQIY